MPATSASPQPLADGLELRTPQSAEDCERLAAFQGSIHGAPLVDMARALMRDHPHASQLAHWLYIEDTRTQQVVAGLCMIPWTLRYGKVMLRTGEMGIVATDERYRGRGLIRALNARFSALLHEEGCDISIIQGIPYFYRQFGYEYAMPLEAWCRVELHTMPASNDPQAGYSFRPATTDDIATLMQYYAEACAQLDVSAVRDEASWRFLLGRGREIETGGETWLITAPGGELAGYLRVMAAGFGDGLICGEASALDAAAAPTALRWLTDLARERGKPYLRLNLPAPHILNQVASSYGASPWRAYAWQVRLLDPPALLQKLAPVFEERLAGGPFKGLSRDLQIDMYRSGLRLRFSSGRLIAVEPEPAGGSFDLRLPPQLLAPLIFGWRSLSEIGHLYPDAYASGGAKPLLETLFRPATAFLYSIY